MNKIFLLAGIPIIASVVFSTLSQTTGLAAAITALNTSVQGCITEINTPTQLLFENQYTVSRVNIDTRGTKDILIQNTSKGSCGTAGCMYEICLVDDTGVQKIAFGFAAERITVKSSATNQMYDLDLVGNSTVSLEWDGSRYIIK